MPSMRRMTCAVLVGLGVLAGTGSVLALQPRHAPARFDQLVRIGPATALPTDTRTADALAPTVPAKEGWSRFVAEQNGGWQGWFDSRTGLPALVQGRGVPWVAGRGNKLAAGGPVTVESLEKLARAFLDSHTLLLGRWDGQLVLDRDASGRLGTSDVWQVTFRQVVGGVLVDGARYNFQVAHGNLVSFGATKIAAVKRSATPALGVAEARAALDRYLGAGAGDAIDAEPGRLLFLPVDPRGETTGWNGDAGAGYAHALAWRFVLTVPGEPATWVADVDADSGAVLSFTDDTKYDRIMGGVYPTSNDGRGFDGTLQPQWPMPFADYTENGGPVQFTGNHGLYQCTTQGSTITTTFHGKYCAVNDSCGALSDSTTCENPLDLEQTTGTDCSVPPGHTAGDTHSGRSSFYHLTRVMEKGQTWLPDNNWLKSQLPDNVNIFSTCNAFWNGSSVNFYRSGGGCRNTGEIAGVFVHEWGHGIDNNDGGGYDNPTEAYADTVALLYSHVSCIGRGFWADDHNCSGYGDTCIDCSGIRDQDWNMHQSHQPATVNWANTYCGGGSGPCGKEGHCESYIAGEAVYDLGARDLPASGLDAASSWQHAEQLFYLSRKGSGGDAYTCNAGAATSDGCNSGSWFHTMRLADDDDGNLNNGTPHAAAIFAAFNRHKIACGAAGDASNQSSSGCPALATPQIGVTAGSNANTINWAAVPNAASYRILRNDSGCSYSQNIVGSAPAPATSYTDTPVANNFTVYYRIQAIGANSACVSPVSDCVSSSAQPFAGAVRFDRPTYGCSTTMTITVTDGNIGGPTTDVTVWSDTEPTPETLTLTQVAPGSAKYSATFPTTSAPAVHGDGFLSIHHGDTITARYIDADDGNGNTNVPVTSSSTGDCVYPVITGVHDEGTTDTTATVRWSTDENSDTVLVWGPTKPPSTTNTGLGGVTDHRVPLSGLQQCTIYYYEVHSTDPAGNLAVANNGGNWFHFETQGIFGGVMQPCHQGRVTVAKKTLACSDTVGVSLVDIDLNANPNAVETAVVTLTSTTETTPETLVLTETGPNTSTFSGTAHVGQGAPVPHDGIVQLANGDTLTVTYNDANDGTGATHVSFDTAVDDCAGADIGLVRVTDVTDEAATVRFNTSEPTTGRVDWGPTAALGNTVSDSTLATSHGLRIGPLLECGRLYFRVTTTDTYGNVTVIDRAGVPFEFNAGIIPGVWRDNFETLTGWTLEPEWEIGAPLGKGTAPGDPLAAYAGTKVLGTDLTGTGAWPGDYEPKSNARAISPVINASGLTGAQLKLRRWLNVAGGAQAVVEVKTSTGWQAVDNTNSYPVTESSWSLKTIDLQPYANNNPNLQIAFRIWSGPGLGTHAAGWNIDRVVVHSANTPDFDACGGCGGAPTFGGVQSAWDADACANNGTILSWKEAPSWGTGHPGTYVVYRDTTPNFTPSSANQVAKGVTGTSWNDTTAPDNATLYYVVRAENDETCSSGPNNHGAMDANTVYASVRTTSSRPVPGNVNGIDVDRVNSANLRLSWPSIPDTSTYRVYRSITPLAGDFGRLAETAGLFQDDIGAGADQATYYYLVKAANACGNEGP